MDKTSIMTKKAILLLLVSLCSLWGMGQQISITTFRVKSSLPADVNSWANDPTSLMLVANKIPLQKFSASKLLLQIKSKGSLVFGYQPQEITISEGSFTVKTFSVADLISLLPKSGNLKPGTYELSAQFFNGENVAMSKESVKTIVITNGGVQQKSSAACTNVAINSPFASCHGSLNSVPAYAYIPSFTNNSGQQIISWAISSTDVTFDNNGVPGSTYTGIPATLNLGTISGSAIMFTNPAPMPIYFNFTFTLADGSTCTSKVAVDYTPCTPPNACTCNAWPSVIKYGTNPTSSSNTPTYYGTIANNGTITLAANEYLTFPGLAAPGCTGNPCASSLIYEIYNPANTLVISTTGNFDAGTLWEQPCNSTGKYKIVIKAKCGTTSCNDFIVWVNKPCSVPVPCNCGIWKQGKATYTLLNTLNTNSPVDCGKQLTVDCDKPVTITNSITCTGTCPAPSINTYTIYNPNGSVLSAGTGTTVVFTPSLPTPLPYKVVLKSKCGTQQCDSCVIYVNTKCVPMPICDCGDWEILTVNNKSYKCGDKTAWNCNELVKFSARYNCKPNNPDCSATIETTVSRDGKIVWKFGSGTASFINGQFTPTENGEYVITMHPTCNGKLCPPCIITLVVDNCSKCDCKSTQCTKNLWYKDLSTGKTAEFPCNTKTPIVLNCNLNYHFFTDTKCSPDTNCKMTVKGEFRNAAGDLVIQQTPFSSSNAFNIISSTSGNYTFIIKYYINEIECSQCSIPITVKCTVPTCDCGNWDKLVSQTTGSTYACYNSFEIDCNKPFDFSQSYSCNPNNSTCNADIKWEIKLGSQTVLTSGSGTSTVNGTFTPTQNGIYALNFISSCGGKPCPPCSYKIVVKNCCDTKKVILTQNGTAIPANTCINPGQYSLTLSPVAPAVSGTYTIVVTPSGATIGSGAFTSSSIINFSVPQYVCGQKTGIAVTYNWNNGLCKARLDKQICDPGCCNEIKFNVGKVTMNPNTLDFTTTFSTTALPVNINKVKVQILEISAAGGQTWSNANILTLTTMPSWPSNVNQAITTPGDAIWFTGPGLIVNGVFTFAGKIVSITPPPNGPINLKLRYTFYQTYGTCQDIICEKDIVQ
jgi:hypothetical protein